MTLEIRERVPFSCLDTPTEGWLGASTGLYLHKDGIPWYRAQRPQVWHRCRVHSIGVAGTGHVRYLYLRCACGAVLTDRLLRGWEPGATLVWREKTPWVERNSRFFGRHSFRTTM